MSEEQQEQLVQGPGQILSEARQRANLSVQDIASKMRLKKEVIEGIEQDNYDINISLTFIKGYIKLYAKHVKVPEAEVISAFESLNTQGKEPAKLQSFSRRLANQANDDKLMMVTYLVIAVVIALVVIWWFQQSASDTSSSSVSPTSTEQPVIEESQDQEQGVEHTLVAPSSTILEDGSDPLDKIAADFVDTEDTANITSESDQEVEQGDQASEGMLDVIAPVEEINESQLTAPSDIENVASVDLVFEFAGDCWMNLADATGENIAYGVKVKGRVMPVTGVPPFVVTLGAPEVVKISYDGEPVDMSFLNPGQIAKFDLPLSE